MDSFLYRVAACYYKHHKENLKDFTFVFPNRRAGLFFQKYLSNITDIPLFSPEVITIESCFLQASKLQLADKINNLFVLYNIYKDISNSKESFNDFVFWGEVLLTDFNEVDKYLVNAEQLFTNVQDIKTMDSVFDYLTDNQKQTIRDFWGGFDVDDKQAAREKFLSTWKVLFPVYEAFKAKLLSDGLAYEGMMASMVIEALKDDQEIPWIADKQFVFVGFNALTPTEEQFMVAMQKRNQADFYWDYEAETLQEPTNPASLFFKKNTTNFPSKYDVGVAEPTHRELIKLINTPSAVGQTKQIYHILKELHAENNPGSLLKTAVMIPDESLLLPMLYAVPEHIDKINVTMGYPLQFTPVAGLMEHIFDLHKKVKVLDGETKFYHKAVMNILNHQIVVAIVGNQLVEHITLKLQKQNLIYVPAAIFQDNAFLQLIFDTTIAAKNFLNYLINILKNLYAAWNSIQQATAGNELESGFLYQYYITINRLADIIHKQNKYTIDIELNTLISLIKRITSNISIPFVGEPLDGLQIIGALETRGLDFENIIITSFNEGVFPKKTNNTSFIPFNLRRAYGLPTYIQQDAITSYNFYRLIHRAKRIFLLFDSRTEGGNTGEVSRFYKQLKYLYNLDIIEEKIPFHIGIQTVDSISIAKNESIQTKLKAFMDASHPEIALTASSINTYVRCPLSFYFSYIEKIRPIDELSEKIEANVFGNIFHDAISEIYKEYTNKIVSKELINSIRKDEDKLKQYVLEAFAKKYFRLPKGEVLELNGESQLIAAVILKYIKAVLKQDEHYAPFTYISGEKAYMAQLYTKYGHVNLKGFIDRIDEKEGIVRIIDYKTGTPALIFRDWDLLFQYNPPQKSTTHITQIFLYGYIYKHHTQSKFIKPTIVYTKDAYNPNASSEIVFKPDKNPNEIIHNYFDIDNLFTESLTACVEEIFDVNIPFTQTPNRDNCQYCDFKNICNR